MFRLSNVHRLLRKASSVWSPLLVCQEFDYGQMVGVLFEVYGARRKFEVAVALGKGKWVQVRG